jgi:hypothetical protein
MMLLRRLEGSIFHQVVWVSGRGTRVRCLCGLNMRVEDLSRQLRPEGIYSRCLTCSRIEKAHFMAIHRTGER